MAKALYFNLSQKNIHRNCYDSKNWHAYYNEFSIPRQMDWPWHNVLIWHCDYNQVSMVIIRKTCDVGFNKFTMLRLVDLPWSNVNTCPCPLSCEWQTLPKISINYKNVFI